MSIDRIINHCKENGLYNVRLDPVSLVDVMDELTGEHYTKLQRIQVHDPSLEIAISTLDEEGFDKLILLRSLFS